MIQTLLSRLSPWGPLFFGVGFLAPLFATLMISFGVTVPFGISEIQVGLFLGASWGLYAKLKGSWL